MTKEEINYLSRYYFDLLPTAVKHPLKYPYLTEEERAIEQFRLAKIVVEKYSDKVFWNLCPKCNKLARTPKAKQCRFCYHDWH